MAGLSLAGANSLLRPPLATTPDPCEILACEPPHCTQRTGDDAHLGPNQCISSSGRVGGTGSMGSWGSTRAQLDSVRSGSRSRGAISRPQGSPLGSPYHVLVAVPLRGPGSSLPMTFISLSWRRLPPRPLPLSSVLSAMMHCCGMERTDLVEEGTLVQEGPASVVGSDSRLKKEKPQQIPRPPQVSTICLSFLQVSTFCLFLECCQGCVLVLTGSQGLLQRESQVKLHSRAGGWRGGRCEKVVQLQNSSGST